MVVVAGAEAGESGWVQSSVVRGLTGFAVTIAADETVAPH
jgi:hypothetical protein